MVEPQVILSKLLEDIEGLNSNSSNTIIKPITTDGANYSSVIFKVTVTQEDNEELHLFAKVATMSESMRNAMESDQLYQTERFVYEHLIKIYESIQENHEVPEDERFVFPKFYGCNPNRMEETIVLEDLLHKGYIMYDRFKSVDWDYASKAVEELAKFHALSFAYKHEYSDEYESKKDDLRFKLNQSYDELSESFLKMARAAYSAVSEDMRGRLENFLKMTSTEEMFNKYYGSSRYSHLVHGDYRSSNILHKVEEGKVTSLIPVDYQTVRISSPATDLLYFIYSGTDGEFRKNHFEQLLDHYYATIAKFLKYFDLDPEVEYSRKDFDEEFAEMRPFGLNTAIFLLPIVVVDKEEAPKVDAEGATIEDFSVKANEKFKIRFNEALDDFVKWGLL